MLTKQLVTDTMLILLRVGASRNPVMGSSKPTLRSSITGFLFQGGFPMCPVCKKKAGIFKTVVVHGRVEQTHLHCKNCGAFLSGRVSEAVVSCALFVRCPKSICNGCKA